VSSAAGDTTQTLPVECRKADGTIVSQTISLNGTTAVILNTNGAVDRILKVELSATCAGTITVRKSVAGATYRVIPIGERGFSMVFRKGTSSTSGTVNYYAKLFWKNTNGANALLSAQVSESADPSGTITHGLATAVDDSGTTTNRQTAPGGVTIDGTAKNVPGTDLGFGHAIGLWLNMTLATNNAAIRSTYTSQLAGSTT
jgi:Flp pilus assembly protein TadG